MLPASLLGSNENWALRNLSKDIITKLVVIQSIAVGQPLNAPVIQRADQWKSGLRNLYRSGNLPGKKIMRQCFDRFAERSLEAIQVVQGVREVLLAMDGWIDFRQGSRLRFPSTRH